MEVIKDTTLDLRREFELIVEDIILLALTKPDEAMRSNTVKWRTQELIKIAQLWAKQCVGIESHEYDPNKLPGSMDDNTYNALHEILERIDDVVLYVT